jgi:NhaP-type Na+/H+ or K+/H+ antiporter
MKKYLTSTEGGKAGTIDGLNLFFGALLGANLGTVNGLALYPYVLLIILLAGMVMALRMISTSPRKGMMVGTILVYVAILGGVALVPKLQPRGLDPGDLHRLIATLIVWVVFVLAAEFGPVEKTDAETAS